jgi:hypothetical protein
MTGAKVYIASQIPSRRPESVPHIKANATTHPTKAFNQSPSHSGVVGQGNCHETIASFGEKSQTWDMRELLQKQESSMNDFITL